MQCILRLFTDKMNKIIELNFKSGILPWMYINTLYSCILNIKFNNSNNAHC